MHEKSIIENNYEIKIDSMQKRRSVYKVQSKYGSYAVKKYSLENNLVLQSELLKLLEKKGFRLCPKLILTKQGRPVLRVGNERYIVTEWIEGERVTFVSDNCLQKAAALLATFHNVSCSNELIKGAPVEYNNATNYYKIKIGQYRVIDILQKIKLWCDESGEEIWQQALDVIQKIKNIFPQDIIQELVVKERTAYAVAHGDFNSCNIIKMNNGILKLIDFDDCFYGPRITDLIFLCQLHMGTRAIRVQKALRAYHSIRPLSKGEFELFKTLIMIPARAFWEMHIRTYVGLPVNKDWLKQNVVPYLSDRLFDNINSMSYDEL